MGRYIIQGGSPIQGEIKVNGGKNAILPILAASVLNGGISVIHNCPKISDLYIAVEILEEIGCHVKWEGRSLIIDSKEAKNLEINQELVKKMRSSIIFLGAVLGRFHKVKIAYPGGCEIGARPIDFHLKAVKKMGAKVREEEGFLVCETKGLSGTKINLKYPSVGATENIMLASVLAQGETVIYNGAKEPEIVDLQNFLNAMGAKVSGAESGRIVICGVTKLHDVNYSIMPDRIEAGTFLAAAAMTKGEILLHDVVPEHNRQILLRLEEMGCKIKEMENKLYLKAPKVLKAADIIKTQPYPGFPTDMQPQFMSLLTLAKGTSIIIETVFESRFKQIVELQKLGADISQEGQMAVIKGVPFLQGACVSCCDLRCGAALILAGLAAQGETIVENSIYVERGYEQIEKAFLQLGGHIVLEEEKEEDLKNF